MPLRVIDGLTTAAIVSAAMGLATAAGAEIPLSDSCEARPAVEPGHYACRDLSRPTMESFTSQFDIVDEATYVYRGSEPASGTYDFDPATGEIRWTSGPYSSAPGETDIITGISATRLSDSTPVIVLRFFSPSYPLQYEYCALLEE